MTAAIYFITVNYYCSDFIQALIAATATIEGSHYEFIVVNNSPEDKTIAALLSMQRVTVLHAEKNLGFGGGCNLALDYVYGRDPQGIAWLINPDARLTPNAIDYVRQCLATDDAIAILGTRIRDMEGRLWFTQGTFNPWVGTLKHRFEQVNCDPTPVATHPTRWLSGCSMLFNLRVFDHCPHFNLQYFLDYEDADISERYYRQGYRLRVTQAVLVDHQVSAITCRNPRAKYQHATFSKLYFLAQHGTPLALGLNLIYFALKPLTFHMSDPAMAKGRWAGLLDYWRWRWQKLRRISTPYHPQTSFTTTLPESAVPEP